MRISDRDAAMSELDMKTRRPLPCSDNFANRLTGNYARTSFDVKLRQSRQQDMISLAAIDDQ